MRIYLYSALRVMVFQVGDLRVGIFLATKGQRGKGTKGQRHKGTKAQRDKGTKAQRDKGTKGQRDKGAKGQMSPDTRHKGTRTQDKRLKASLCCEAVKPVSGRQARILRNRRQSLRPEFA